MSAVEHSGLESGLSGEAVAGQAEANRRTIFFDAQQGRLDDKMWIAFDATATGLHYVWMRSRSGEGRGTIDLDMPAADQPWRVWARVKGEEGAEFALSGGSQSLTLAAPPSPSWTWQRFDGRLALPAGRSQAVLTSRRYGSGLDCLALTTDPQFDPRHSPRSRGRQGRLCGAFPQWPPRRIR